MGPLLFTTIWGDQPAGNGRYNLPIYTYVDLILKSNPPAFYKATHLTAWRRPSNHEVRSKCCSAAQPQLSHIAPLNKKHLSEIPSLKLTANALENRPSQKGKDRLPTIHFQVRAVSFKEGRLGTPKFRRYF